MLYNDLDYQEDYESKGTRSLTKEEEFAYNIDNSINRRLKSFFNTLKNHRDPLSYVLSNKIIWLYNALDDIGKTSLHNYILDAINNKFEVDQIKATLTIDSSQGVYKLHFRKGSRHILDWIPMQDKIIIPNYDKAIELNNLLQKKESELSDLEEEIVMTSVWIKNPMSLVDNGMRRLYIFSVFRPKKFKLSMKNLMDELDNDKSKLELEINGIKENISMLLNDSDLLLTLKKSGIYFMYFPNINKLSDYTSL